MSNVNSDYYLSAANNVNTKRSIQGKGADELNMDDFLNLLMAQMTNQDMNNPQENTEFVAQMAQFTTLQGMKQIQEYQLSSYAVSYVGKNVTIAETNEYTGKLETINGTVENITFYDGSPQVVVNGKTYALYKIMEVNAAQGSGSGSLTDYANYIGKNVRILHANESGTPETINGKVERVTLVDGKPYVVVNGNEYPANEIQAVISDEDAAFLKESEEMQAKYMKKKVSATQTDEDGTETTVIGVVTDVKYYNMQFYATVEDKDYPISNVTLLED